MCALRDVRSILCEEQVEICLSIEAGVDISLYSIDMNDMHNSLSVLEDAKGVARHSRRGCGWDVIERLDTGGCDVPATVLKIGWKLRVPWWWERQSRRVLHVWWAYWRPSGRRLEPTLVYVRSLRHGAR